MQASRYRRKRKRSTRLRKPRKRCLQAAAIDGLDPAVRRQLKRRGRLQFEGLNLGIGARIRREWQGRMVEVEVVEAGFLCDGQVQASLSAAATAIAGTRWNGPRLFGLRSTQL